MSQIGVGGEVGRKDLDRDSAIEPGVLRAIDVVGDWHINQSLTRGQEILRWFNTSAFALNPIGTVGTAGVNIVRGPAMSNLDFAAFKNFQIKERFKIQFRAEFFNSMNHPVLGNPNTTFTNGNFGKILGTQTAPRVGELGLKLLF